MGINEYDLMEINDIRDGNHFNHTAKHISRKIGLRFIKSNGRIDYDLQELYIIKMYNRLHILNPSSERDYSSFRKLFQDWVFIAIQDLGYSELANNYKYNPELIIEKSNSRGGKLYKTWRLLWYRGF